MGGEPVYIIYADVLFLINFCLDFICLYITSRLCSCPASIWRTLGAAAIGGIYSAAALMMSAMCTPLLVLIHFAAAFVICFAAFFGRSIKKTLISTVVFAVSCAVTGGILTAVFTLAGKYSYFNGGFYADISAGALLAVAAAAGGVALVFGLLSKRRLNTAYAEIEAVYAGKRYRLRLLADSGNLLCEPVSGLPVIMLRRGTIPADDSLSAESGNRVIPFTSAGGSDILIGFKAEKLYLLKVRGKKEIDAYLAFGASDGNFAGTDGIFPASLL